MRITRLRSPEILAAAYLLIGAAAIVAAVMMATGHPGWRWTFPSMTLAAGGGFVMLSGLALLVFGRWLRLRLKTIKIASGDGDAN